MVVLSKRSSNRNKSNSVVLQPREGRDLHGLALPRSLATTKGIIIISFPEGTKMFQFPSLASRLAG